MIEVKKYEEKETDLAGSIVGLYLGTCFRAVSPAFAANQFTVKAAFAATKSTSIWRHNYLKNETCKFISY